jgi:hypothetical protein
MLCVLGQTYCESFTVAQNNNVSGGKSVPFVVEASSVHGCPAKFGLSAGRQAAGGHCAAGEYALFRTTGRRPSRNQTTCAIRFA